MKLRCAVPLLAVLLPCVSPAQTSPAHDGMAMGKPAPVASTTLTLTGLSGKTKTFTPAQFKTLPHVSVTVQNAHNNRQETYSGVSLKDLLATVEPAKGEGPRTSMNMQVVIASATDGFHVVITLCDTNPDCRNGQAIVADTLDGEPLKTDGAFKLVLSEDKKPARWARNLQSLTVKPID